MNKNNASRTTAPTCTIALAGAAIAFACGGQRAAADVIYQTNTPFGGPFGLIGFDVSSEQSVALRFTPPANFTLDRVGVWFMNNDFSGQTHPLVTITLRTNDDEGNIPSNEILEQWQFNVSAVGWDPVLEQLDSIAHPALTAGERYWIVAESEAPGGLDGVWNWAANDSGIMSICNGHPCEWSQASQGAVAAGIIEGSPVKVIGDVNGDGSVNVGDLIAVILAWGPCPKPPAPCPADVNDSGAVDVSDLVIVILNWG